MITDDPVLKCFRAGLEAAYGGRLHRVVLFGSRARGDNSPDSDYDVAVFLNEPQGLGAELDVLTSLGADILMESGAFVSAKPFAADRYDERTGFMGEVRREGIDI